MTTAELQQQLLARGIIHQGLNKFQLQDNLWRCIQIEAGLLPAEETGVGLLAASASNVAAESDAHKLRWQAACAYGESMQFQHSLVTASQRV